MGYTTDFYGEFTITPALTAAQVEQINKIEDGKDIAAWTPDSYSQWVASKDGKTLRAEGEKFYDYVDWLRFIANMLEPWGCKLNGEVEWQGEDKGDSGVIFAKDNKVESGNIARVKPTPSWGKR